MQKKLTEHNKKSKNLEKMEHEILKMKRGSIALIGQIITVSKIRIYDPLFPNDVLSHIKISNKSMDKIDFKIKELFTNSKPMPPVPAE